MKCELCGKEILVQGGECSECSTHAIKEKLEALILESIEILSKKMTAEGQGELCFQIANFYRFSGMYDEAIRWYERALTDKNVRPECHRSLGSALAAKTDYQGALEAFLKAVELAPKYPDFRSDLGVAYFKLGRYEEAIKAFQEAISINPRYANAYNNLAFAYRKKGLYAQAEEALQTAIRLEPQHAVGDYDLGKSFYSGGMFSQLRSPFKIDAKTLGDIYFLRNKYDEAVEYYSLAIKIHPRYADLHCSLGIVYAAMGWKDQARRAFETAIEINPKYEKAKQELARLGEMP